MKNKHPRMMILLLHLLPYFICCCKKDIKSEMEKFHEKLGGSFQLFLKIYTAFERKFDAK
jgi:hypothetical protein